MARVARETPMVRVWMIVIGSMLFVALAGIFWHTNSFLVIRAANIREANAIRKNIGTLRAYVAAHPVASTSPVRSSSPSL